MARKVFSETEHGARPNFFVGSRLSPRVHPCPDDAEPVNDTLDTDLQVLGTGRLDEVPAADDAAFGQGGCEGVQKFAA